MARIAILSGLALVAALVLWLNSGDAGDPSNTAASVVDGGAPAAGEPEASIDPAPALQAVSPQAVTPQAVSTAAPAAEPSEPLAATAAEVERTAAEPEGTPITIHVVDESGAPRAGAEVVVLDRAHYDRRAFRDARRAAKDPSAEDAVLREFGRVLVTDASGCAVHRWSEERTEVHVFRPARTPRVLMKRHEEGRLTIVCPDAPLVVEVRGADGGPVAGVPVFVLDGLSSAQQGKLAHVRLGAFHRTAADGTCAPTAALAAAEMISGSDSIQIDLGVLLEDGAARSVELSEGESQRLVYDLPPLASVRVRVTAPGGEPVPDGSAMVVLHTRPPTMVAGDTPPGVAAIVEGGEAHFPWVEPGLLLFGTASSARTTWRAEFEHAGPTRAGEELVIDVAGVQNPAVRLRLLDPEGQPLVEKSVTLQRQTGFNGHWSQARTDAEGRLTVADGDSDWSRSSETTRLVVEYERGGRSLTGEVELPQIEGNTVVDLGDLRLGVNLEGELVRIVDGFVVDGSGAPVEGVQVSVFERVFESEGRGGGSRGRRGPTVHTDDEGRFELHGPGSWRDKPFELHLFGAIADNGASVAAEFGDSDLRLVVERMGEVTVELLGFDDSLDQPRAMLTFTESQGPGIVTRSTGAKLGRETTVSLTAGEYDLAIALDRETEPVLSIGGLLVEGGRPCADSRLRAIDLRHHWRRGRLSVGDESGAPLAAAYRFEGPFSKGGGACDGDGFAEFFARVDEPLAFFVGAPQYVPRSLREQTGDVSLRLAAGGEIRLALDGVPASINPRKLAVHLRLDEEFAVAVVSPDAVSISAPLDESADATIAVCGPGRYRASVVLPQDVAAELGEAWLANHGHADLGVLDVGAVGAGASYRLSFPEQP